MAALVMREARWRVELRMDPYRIDGHKVMYHPHRLAEWLEAGQGWAQARDVYPIYVEVSPIGACNHRCTFCAIDYLGYEPNSLDADVLSQRFGEMSALGVKSVMFGGEGEPLIHKRAGDLIASARGARLDLALTSNGVLMGDDFTDRSLADFSWIKVSCNAGTREGYSRIHRTRERDFDTVLGNVRRAAEAKRSRRLGVTVGVQIVLLPENAGEVEILARRCRDEIRPDYLVVKPYSQHLFSETHQYDGLRYGNQAELRETLEKYSDSDFRLIFRAHTMGKLGSERGYERCCSTPFLWAYVMSTGDVYACSAFLGDERFRLGNLHEASFEEIWQSQERRRCLEYVQSRLDISDCRVNCRMDEVNRFLWELKHPSAHVNFI